MVQIGHPRLPQKGSSVGRFRPLHCFELPVEPMFPSISDLPPAIPQTLPSALPGLASSLYVLSHIDPPFLSCHAWLVTGHF